ncbi:hypothetical protein Taro_042741 [Colocasia esculenta]|uniref:Uncharacterized protein n=1 Tax=Colocasia esculenta TaxID=4460 RepID=A0A843X339_COLES|nr:hypothetical protein [Colocasia esculenta]
MLGMHRRSRRRRWDCGGDEGRVADIAAVNGGPDEHDDQDVRGVGQEGGLELEQLLHVSIGFLINPNPQGKITTALLFCFFSGRTSVLRRPRIYNLVNAHLFETSRKASFLFFLFWFPSSFLARLLLGWPWLLGRFSYLTTLSSRAFLSLFASGLRRFPGNSAGLSFSSPRCTHVKKLSLVVYEEESNIWKQVELSPFYVIRGAANASKLNMHFGFSWAEDLYQKWENICHNNIIVQEPAKIVDAVGVQVRKIYEEVADDWLNSFSLDNDGASTFDLSLEQDVMTDSCEQSRASHDKDPLSEESLNCPISRLAIASKEIETVPLSDIEKDERKEACDLFSLGCDKALVSDLSLEQDVMADVCEESKANPFDGPICKGSDSYICPTSALAVAFPLPDIEKNERKEVCMFFDKEVALTPLEANLCSCSSEIRYINNEISSLSTSISLLGSVLASDNICPSPTSHSGSLPTSDSIFLSDLSLDRDVKADVCETSRIRHDKELICEASSICSLPDLAIASDEMKVVPLPSIEKDERKEACELFDKDIARTSPEANFCGSSSEIKHNNEDILDLSAYTSHVASLPAVDNICQLHENRVERQFMISHFTDPTEDGKSASQDGMYLVESFSTVHEKTSSSSEPETSLSITDVGSSDCFNEHNFQHSITIDKLESIEEFEDVSLEDFLDEKTLDECWKEELALISHRAMKNRSYKTKLRDAFTSRFCSSKNNKEQGASFSGDLSADLAKIGTSSPSLVSSRVSGSSNLVTLESPESDWELL